MLTGGVDLSVAATATTAGFIVSGLGHHGAPYAILVAVGVATGIGVVNGIGVAVFPSDGTTSTDLIARADAALYFAKKHGKNLVMMAGELPAQGAGVAS